MWFGVQIEKSLIIVGNLIGYTELQIYKHNVFFQLWNSQELKAYTLPWKENECQKTKPVPIPLFRAARSLFQS